MKINEVEKILGVPKATIRFYEKEGLLMPLRNEKAYREYSEEDVEQIKKIIVFRKIGIPVEDIRQILNDKMTLQEALSKNIFSLYEKMKELEGVLKLCMILQEKDAENDSFDTGYYWEMVHNEETAGKKFFAVINDVISFEKQVIGDRFDLLDENGKMKYSVLDSIMIAGITCVICGLLWSFMNGMSGEAFLQGMMYPFALIIIYSAIGLPLFFIKGKDKRTARTIRIICRNIFIVVCTAIVVVTVINYFG
ncbi:MAG: MerR family transcriptional regulator [Firmicutes bacterium]|nr:MerR family transcriptional regulator [Bacillota bacterium]